MENARRRISITLQPAVADRLDTLCNALGVTRSAMVTLLLADRIPQLEKEWSLEKRGLADRRKAEDRYPEGEVWFRQAVDTAEDDVEYEYDPILDIGEYED